MERSVKSRGYAAIGIQKIIKDGNFGGVMRAAHCYDAKLIILGGKMIREVTDVSKAYRHVPVMQNQDIMEAIPYDCVPIAVDLIEGAKPLMDFVHPERAYYIFGAENATLSKSITDKCQHVIYVPTQSCMNLSATVNVVLYDRLAKQWRKSK